MIRVMVIDDERLARMELRRLLAVHAEIDLVGEASGVREAKQRIDELKPELIFLDVQMPDGSGFDLLAQLDHAPDVIFTTAFDAYALRAFEVSALDYLQKPIEPARLGAAIERAQQRQRARQARPQPKRADEKIFIKDGDRCWFVALGDIMLFESEGNYARVYFESNRPLMLRSLNQLEERLDAAQFFRANRRQIVNLNFVRKVTPTDLGGLTITMANELRIELSRRRAVEFKALSSL